MRDSVEIHVKTPSGHIDRNVTSNEWEKRKIDWVTFYRRNIHRFIEHYFKIKLFPYQILWVYYMSICDYFITIASRASAKSWLIAVYSCAIAVLYPHSEIILVSLNKITAAKIMEKIDRLRLDHPNIFREIAKFQNSSNVQQVLFNNTSTITVAACRESGRGARATLTIGEEFRLMDKVKYDSIVKPFAYARQAPYMNLPEWKDLPPEEPKEILISSAYHKGMWWYAETCKVIKAMLAGKSAGFIAFDYLTAVYHKIKTMNLIRREKESMDPITFMEEYENIPWGENSDAYFKLSMFERARDIRKAFYPQRQDTYNPKKNPYGIKKVDGEIRIVSADIASRAGTENDNTIITCTRCLPTNDGYIREISYMESHNGENTFTQALRIKQLFYDFDSDYFVLDVQNSGISIFDDLGLITKDEERDIEYPAWTTMWSEDMDKSKYEELFKRTLANNALEIIYPISASQKLNSDIAVAMREKLQKGMMKFLSNELEAEDYLIKNNQDYMKYSEDFSERAWYLHPYIQISSLINECVGLSMTLQNGYIKLKESAGARKDRYTSVSYMNYFVSTVLDPRIRRDGEELDEAGLVDTVFW